MFVLGFNWILFDQCSLPFIVLVTVIIVAVILTDIILNCSNSKNWYERVVFFWNLIFLGPGQASNYNYWFVVCSLFYWSVWFLVNLLFFPPIINLLVHKDWFIQLPFLLVNVWEQTDIAELVIIAKVIMLIVQFPQQSALVLALFDAVIFGVVWDKFNHWLSGNLLVYKLSLLWFYHETYPFNSVILNLFIRAIIFVIDWLPYLLLLILFFIF